ncbi:MAG TPA: cytochrome c biogenesis protein CcsA [Bryobacteraceae bacterium]|nr:cytochrome c biogenesis protein CcsA [Bryobacteraceae bacterium]
MQDMSVFWLRAAVALYAVGLFHTIQVALRKGATIFRPALIAFIIAIVLHMVALVEAGRLANHFPPGGFHNSVSLCAFLLGVLFLIAYARYRFESLGLFVFPIVFVMSAVASIQAPTPHWDNGAARGAWLVVHIVLVLLGYAALVLTALASVFYLVQERQLKRKKSMRLLERLPPLGTLDNMITRSLGFGFVLLTVGVVTGATWSYIDAGPNWTSDPRLTVALITWVVCLLMVFLRVTAGWRGRKAAAMAVAVVAFSAATWAVHYVSH